MSSYRAAPHYVVRLTGAPVDRLLDLATPDCSRCARELLAIESELAVARAAAIDAVNLANRAMQKATRKAIRRDLDAMRPIADATATAVLDEVGRLAELDRYQALVAASHRKEHELATLLEHQVSAAIAAIERHAATYLPRYALFASDALIHSLRDAGDAARPLDSARRNDARHLAMYLQRICAKSDTISEFGPVGWGVVAPGEGFVANPTPGIARRTAELERWVGRALVTCMNHDVDVRSEVAPRVHGNGRVEGDRFIRLDTGATVELGAGDRALLARCDGSTPAHAIGELERLATLAEAGVVVWQVELVAMDRSPVGTLREDVERWRDAAARRRWQPILERLAGTPAQFAATPDPAERRAILEGVESQLTALGAALPQVSSMLYAARNPIIEECHRECGAVLGQELVDRFLRDASPFFDFYRDYFALAAAHAFERIAPLVRAPQHAGEVSLPALLAYAETRGVALRGGALIQIAGEMWEVAKARLQARLAGRAADAAEWQLSPDDFRVLRGAGLALAPVDALSWPSADLQIIAASPAAAARGDCRWVIGEVHHGGVFVQHAMNWSCPDRAMLRRYMHALLAGEPWCVHSHGQLDIPVHASSESVMNDVATSVFVAPERARPQWLRVALAETRVIVDEANLDIRVQARATGADLGSLVRSLLLAFGAHPFFPLSLRPHTPRLRLGEVIVQRETWFVTRDELAVATKRGAPARLALALAIERLRAARGLPRWVFVRPSAPGLERAKFTGKSKDLKPIYIDLESYVFMEIFAQRLDKYSELEVIEMLPRPGETGWREPDGGRTFELRIGFGPERGA